MRTLIAFRCAGETLVGTLDRGERRTGLLIVSGGNEVRSGAHRGMALLAQRVAAAGYSVFRFDRRGIGDSTGDNKGWEQSAPDIAAAVAEFRHFAPGVERIVGFGNCDAATALALFGADAGVDSLLLANPWTRDDDEDDGGDALPPTAAIRARYAERLRDPRNWLRALRGDVDLRKLLKGMQKLTSTRSRAERDVPHPMFAALGGKNAQVVLASRDATAIAFAEQARIAGAALPTTRIDSASHSFARGEDAAALETVILAALA